MKKWNVALSNESSMFDYEDGFNTLRDAVNWALGRGNDYVINIDDGENFLHLCMSKGKLKFECGYREWVAVPDIDKFCKDYG